MTTGWPLLSSLAESQRAELLSVARTRSFAKGDIVCHEGDPADSLHLVADGHFAVRVSLPSGDAVMVNHLGPGDCFGELALLRPDGRRTATVTALERARTLVVTETGFRRLCEQHPAVHRSLSVLLADRVDSLSHDVLELLYVGLDRRVYRRLDRLARSYGEESRSGAGPVVVPLTQAQLAELTGGTRPSVNLALQRLVKEGVITLGRGRVEVLDTAALARYCRY
ncbi:Crp/Fnr family transcriptional regulator [uncultured Nocardioides sp.]|uniref:Crp/Fnr family transcriptional regulator n=1 Tax=uncultured Nocardioides sp. TaxID=198441 RepID=UPI00261FB822|nr:Crp/Fnr family transcriptional regulator [uncultured Nocardioides sp.]